VSLKPPTEDIELLEHPLSSELRAAAKRLRILRDASAGGHLLEALNREVTDPRTWEVHYQLIMALGECQYLPSIPFLKELAGRTFEATMIYVALGDALVRLQLTSTEDARSVIEIMTSGNEVLIDGAFRAMAMLKMVPRADQLREILSFVLTLPTDSDLRYWPLAASAGWRVDGVEMFLGQCERSAREDLQRTAKLARKGIYGKWRPL